MRNYLFRCQWCMFERTTHPHSIDIHEIDEDFFIELYEEDEDGDLGDPVEIYQYFLTNYSDDDVKWMQKTFPQLHFAFSKKMGLGTLCRPLGHQLGLRMDTVRTGLGQGRRRPPVPTALLNWVNDKYESKIDMVKTSQIHEVQRQREIRIR